MRQTTLWMIVVWEKILLCMKKRGFGKWLWNGAWGKCEPGESIEDGMVRELEEETGLKTQKENLKHMWVLHFYFDQNADWNQDVHVFQIVWYEWIPVETEEMKPEWFDIADIPYQEMWEDDIIWLPRMLSWEKIEYDFSFWDDGKIKDYKKIL